MKNAPVMDFWVSTSIFLSGQSKTASGVHGKLLHEVITRRNTLVPQEEKYEIRYPAVKRRSEFAN
jgi:hypothetical protein